MAGKKADSNSRSRCGHPFPLQIASNSDCAEALLFMASYVHGTANDEPGTLDMVEEQYTRVLNMNPTVVSHAKSAA